MEPQAAWFLVIASALLVGCSSVPNPEEPPPGPPVFRDAYVDGCLGARGIRPRNEALFAADSDYQRGWDMGYRVCLDDLQRFPRLTTHGRG
jgi:hypothetical protein